MAKNFQHWIRDASVEAVSSWFYEADASVQRNVRARRVSVDSFLSDLVTQWLRNISFCVYHSGGGVPNSYRDYTETSVYACALYLDPHERRHVRLQAARIEAPKSAYGAREPRHFDLSPSQLDTFPPVVVVYPRLQLPWTLRARHTGRVASILASCKKEPLDPGSWSALYDLLLDEGDYDRDGLTVRLKEVEEILKIVRSILDPTEKEN